MRREVLDNSVRQSRHYYQLHRSYSPKRLAVNMSKIVSAVTLRSGPMPYPRIQCRKVRLLGNNFLLHHQEGFYDACNSRDGLSVANIVFDRAKQSIFFPTGTSQS